MSYENRGRGGYGNRSRSYGNRSRNYSSGGYQRREREMFDTVCSACGVETKVPFKPSGDRPVYCRECYNKKRDNNLTDEQMMANKKPTTKETTDEQTIANKKPTTKEKQ